MNKINKNKGVSKKIYVVDTNVPLHDPFCLQNFKENHVTIPIPILEELDKFKKGNESINHNAREFVRILQSLSSDHLFNGGVSLGKGMGKLRIALGVDYPPEMEKSFSEDTQDHRILAICIDLQKQGENVVLVSNDINLQIKAKALGIPAESYKADAVKDMSKIYSAIEKKEEATLIQDVATNNYSFPELDNYPNGQQFLFGEKAFRKKDNALVFVEKEQIMGLKSRNIEQTFSIDALLDPQIQLIALTGKAGTGKTLLALAAAMMQKKEFSEILVARPIMEMSDNTIGFLPGSKEEKIDPYMYPIYDNLAVIKEIHEGSLKRGNKKVKSKLNAKEEMQTNSKGSSNHSNAIKEWAKENYNIEVLALNFIRGRSLNDRFIIIDEAQNLTPHEVKTIITRAGEGTKIIFTGDIKQVDSPYMNAQSNGLSHVIDKWKGEPEFVHIHLTKGERSPLADKAGDIM